MAYTAFVARNNDLNFQFKSDSSSVDHTAITKVQLVFTRTDVVQADVLIDSSINTDHLTIGADRVTLTLPSNALLVAGNYQVQVFIYDSDNPLGIVWADPVYITVKEI